jgi:glycosyltransferase involved in cell wall biosynthesis
MKFSLIVCTYMRPEPLLKLLQWSAANRISNEILIIDGSKDDATQTVLQRHF